MSFDTIKDHFPISFARPKETGERKRRHEHQPQRPDLTHASALYIIFLCGSHCSWTSTHRREAINF